MTKRVQNFSLIEFVRLVVRACYHIFATCLITDRASHVFKHLKNSEQGRDLMDIPTTIPQILHNYLSSHGG